jgi:branched-chain amino acid transport system ATP-binding protein
VSAQVLEATDVYVSYGNVPAVRGVTLSVAEGTVCVLLGSNGAGKSTVTKAVLGLVRAHQGSILMDGVEVTKLPTHRIHRLGIAWVPQGRQLWTSLTVLENLKVGGSRFPAREAEAQIDRVMERFPRLRERSGQVTVGLSGGEQQMVAIGRALVSQPRLLLMDEPTLGLAPKVVAELFDLVAEIRADGVSVLMVEQNARQALKVADWAYVMEGGRVVANGPADELARSSQIQEIYLGGKA